MKTLQKGRFTCRLATSTSDVKRSQKLRAKIFLNTDANCKDQKEVLVLDEDRFDPLYQHVLVEDTQSGALACSFRFRLLKSGSDISQTYSAQFYDLTRLTHYPGAMIELGRFCLDSEKSDLDVLRMAWSMITCFVDAEDVRILFGCSSFQGTDAGNYLDVFRLLKRQYLSPEEWRPEPASKDIFSFNQEQVSQEPDLFLAYKNMPPLLRSYLSMGGWVSDHAVVDHELNTLHVFTGLEVDKIPPARARLLRAAAT